MLRNPLRLLLEESSDLEGWEGGPRFRFLTLGSASPAPVLNIPRPFLNPHQSGILIVQSPLAHLPLTEICPTKGLNSETPLWKQTYSLLRRRHLHHGHYSQTAWERTEIFLWVNEARTFLTWHSPCPRQSTKKVLEGFGVLIFFFLTCVQDTTCPQRPTFRSEVSQEWTPTPVQAILATGLPELHSQVTQAERPS